MSKILHHPYFVLSIAVFEFTEYIFKSTICKSYINTILKNLGLTILFPMVVILRYMPISTYQYSHYHDIISCICDHSHFDSC